jgi:hypothetical protein
MTLLNQWRQSEEWLRLLLAILEGKRREFRAGAEGQPVRLVDATVGSAAVVAQGA